MRTLHEVFSKEQLCCSIDTHHAPIITADKEVPKLRVEAAVFSRGLHKEKILSETHCYMYLRDLLELGSAAT